MGRIVAPYGVRGWLKVVPQTEQPGTLLLYRTWWLEQDGAWRAYRLLQGREHGRGVVAQLEGIDDRNDAALLRNRPIAVPRADLPPAPEGEFYWDDLIGLAVVNAEGEALGRVEEIFATGANDVLVVRGERERLIPFVETVVQAVDLEGGELKVDWGADY